MQIVIPMSGFGERFRAVGYKMPKPLIEMDGKPIIAHVIDMFPGEDDFIFICNQDHLDTPEYHMAEILKKYCPSGRILGIASHKLGPVYAVLQAAGLIELDEPVIVNYCDFTCYWDWPRYKQFIETSKCDGSIPAYKGFHPHSLGTTNYAYMREQDGWALAIQEKQPYTDNRMEEYASSGTYHFKTGQLMLDAFHEIEQKNITLGGEYYVSLAYIPLLEREARIAIYDLQHFMQWGTPADVREYNRWSDAFNRLLEAEPDIQQPLGSVVIPMAGLGKRFADEGYLKPKPLIEVSGLPMVVQACKDLPLAERYVFVLRSDMDGYQDVCHLLEQQFPSCKLASVPNVTEGQACSAQLGLSFLGQDADNSPVTFGACDFGSLYSRKAFHDLQRDDDVDVIVWSVRGHPHAIANPEMYGWIELDEDGVIRNISVKKPLGNPETDPVVLGTFTFKKPALFSMCYDRLIAQDDRINNEFYLDSCINHAIALGLKCKIFEVDSYLSWGTPNDLKTFNYWQSCFHKWTAHRYRLESDSRIPAGKIPELSKTYSKTVPKLLASK